MCILSLDDSGSKSHLFFKGSDFFRIKFSTAREKSHFLCLTQNRRKTAISFLLVPYSSALYPAHLEIIWQKHLGKKKINTTLLHVSFTPTYIYILLKANFYSVLMDQIIYYADT